MSRSRRLGGFNPPKKETFRRHFSEKDSFLGESEVKEDLGMGKCLTEFVPSNGAPNKKNSVTHMSCCFRKACVLFGGLIFHTLHVCQISLHWGGLGGQCIHIAYMECMGRAHWKGVWNYSASHAASNHAKISWMSGRTMHEDQQP